MNFSTPSKRSCSCTTNAPILSHLASTEACSLPSPVLFNASSTFAIVRSRRWRWVIHSCERTKALAVGKASRAASTERVFPVASTPCMHKLGGLGRSGYASFISKVVAPVTVFLRLRAPLIDLSGCLCMRLISSSLHQWLGPWRLKYA